MTLWTAFSVGQYLKDLDRQLAAAKTQPELYKAIVDAPFNDKNKLSAAMLGLGFLAFLLVNESSNMLDRVTISDTFTAQGAIDMTNKPFNQMKVPLNHKSNIVLVAIDTNRYQTTNDWHLLTDPAVTAEESRMNQAAAGIASSIVYPLVGTNPKGAVIFQYYVPMEEIEDAHHKFMFGYVKLVSATLNNLGVKKKGKAVEQ